MLLFSIISKTSAVGLNTEIIPYKKFIVNLHSTLFPLDKREKIMYNDLCT